MSLAIKAFTTFQLLARSPDSMPGVLAVLMLNRSRLGGLIAAECGRTENLEKRRCKATQGSFFFFFGGH